MKASLPIHSSYSPGTQYCESSGRLTPINNENFGSSSSNNLQKHQFAPNFLFGSQPPPRRSFARQTGCYVSPGILKSRELSTGGVGNKSVHWSPVLVRERSKSPDARKIQRLSNGGRSPTSSMIWNGPPLRSLNEDIVGGPPLKHSRLEPPDQPMLSSFASSQTTTTKASPMNNSNGVGGGGGERMGVEDEMTDVEELNGEELGYTGESDNVSNGVGAGDAAGARGDSHWVTVFGFLPDHRDDVLELFSRHGDIMTQKSAKGANWVHIRYSSPVHARQALAKNTTLFRGQMIGVVPCKECDAMATQEKVAMTNISSTKNLNGSSNASSLLLDPDGSSLLLNGGGGSVGSPKFVPSTSAYRSSMENTSMPSRARLSVSARTGMRPLNSSLMSMDGDRSMDSSMVQQKANCGGTMDGSANESFIGKLWGSMFGSGSNSQK